MLGCKKKKYEDSLMQLSNLTSQVIQENLCRYWKNYSLELPLMPDKF